MNFDIGEYTPAVTRLQIEFFTAGYKTVGDHKGGWYRPTRKGFVPMPGAPYGPGVPLLPISDVGGAYYDSYFEIRNVAGNWWVLHNDNWLGHYPGPLFDLMTFEACEVHWYGEVFDKDPSEWTITDMGSGRFAAEGLGYAAYFRLPAYVDSAGMVQWPDGASAVPDNDPSCYTSSGLKDEGVFYERVMYTSGSGRNSSGCN